MFRNLSISAMLHENSVLIMLHLTKVISVLHDCVKIRYHILDYIFFFFKCGLIFFFIHVHMQGLASFLF